MHQVYSLNLKSNSKKLVFLIHGYTGSPDDFNKLPQYLNQKYKVNVQAILLKGHGTKIQDIDSLEFNDFLDQVENKFKKNLDFYEEIVVGGVSFGAQIALYLAANYSIKGVFNVGLPFRLKILFNIPGTRLLGIFKKYWPKFISAQKRKERGRAFYYPQSHIKGLKIVKQANYLLKKEIKKISCPVLTIYSKKDHIVSYKTIKYLDRKIQSLHNKKIFNEKSHNIFFTDKHEEAYVEIGNFLIQ